MSRDWDGEQRRREGERDAARLGVDRLSELIRSRVGVMQTPGTDMVAKYRSARERLEAVNADLADLLQQRVLQEQS